MVRMSDVAAAAGLSTATVSRALNNSTTVNPEYAARAREAAERLGYRPNRLARGLRKQSTEVLALIISDVSNPFFTAVTRGVEDVAQRAGYSVLLCNTDEDASKEATYLEVAELQQVAGVILSPHQAGSDLSRLRSAGIPVVTIDRLSGEAVDTVTAASAEAAADATRHLLESGWSRPAFITGPEVVVTARQRLEGYLSVAPVPLYRWGPFTREGGAANAASLLDGDPSPDAFLTANAAIALGALGEIRDRGLRVGEDVGFVTFDEAPWAELLSPPVSVVAQPAYQIGSAAADLLMRRITGHADMPEQHIVLPTRLVPRASSARRAGC